MNLEPGTTPATMCESDMETLEGLFAYLEGLDAGSKPAMHPSDCDAEERDDLLKKARNVLGSISLKELRANRSLRRGIRELIREIFVIESYVEDKTRFDASIQALGR